MSLEDFEAKVKEANTPVDIWEDVGDDVKAIHARAKQLLSEALKLASDLATYIPPHMVASQVLMDSLRLLKEEAEKLEKL